MVRGLTSDGWRATQQYKMAAQQKMHPSAEDGARASRSTTPFRSLTRKSPRAPFPCRRNPPSGSSLTETVTGHSAARCAVPKTMCQSSPARPSLANRRKRRPLHRERRSFRRRRHHSLHQRRLSSPKLMSIATTLSSECRQLLSLQHLEPLRWRGKSRHPLRRPPAQRRSVTVGAKSNSSGGVPASRLPFLRRQGRNRE